ncbi:hypothetical protein SeMB42_g04915 [Synchytrium endobioticum]|uniref:RING-type domain-containing protein n=1 Tax=Synchytrium endobioticum TaxID=286115 RepID=A0A507CVS8_9FUNG|nr:hypothetical protein SeMB42_g04915 [Synchytrium endobioticum]
MKVVHPGVARARVERLARRIENSRKSGLRAESLDLDEEVTGLLDLCLVKLTGHKNGYGTWEDPPVCSNCKRPIWLVNDRELSCNHVFHRECVPKSGQPCPRCTAEGGQTS